MSECIKNNNDPVEINEPVYSVHLCSPTNSQMFTNCCDTAICSDQKRCPGCGSLIYGWDANSNSERGLMRWRRAYHK